MSTAHRLFDAGDGTGLQHTERGGNLLGVCYTTANDDGHRFLFHDAPGGFKSVQARHVDVHKHHIWPVLLEKIQRSLAVVDRADDADPQVGLKQVNQMHPRHRGIIHHQDIDFFVRHAAFISQFSARPGHTSRRTASSKLFSLRLLLTM